MEIYKISNNTLQDISFKEFKKSQEQRFWIICEPEEVCQHNDFFKFHQSTIEECKNRKQHPRLEIYDDVSFGVINIIDHTGNWFEAKEINFYITQNYIVFVSKGKNRLIEQIKSEIAQNAQSSTNYNINESKILYMLLDRLTSMDNVILKKIETNIEHLEEQVLSGVEKDFSVQIIQLRKQLLYLKRYYEPLIDIAEGLEENENGLIDESAIRFFTILINRIQRLNNNVANLRDYVTQVREAYQAQVDIKLNKTMKLFTVVTTIFLPLTLIAGWYGMNFTYMPELKWVLGYPSVIALSLAVVAVCLVYFKRHNYL
ncbi:MAG TPA: CorA family divalent cation transporter [Patescibacteria group bacterium]|nr:CorA family divalent cation transporter [Patescibacteria group bacterium]